MAQGTAVIGYPLIQETEFRVGSTIRLDIDTGPTLGKTYVSNFRHNSIGTLPPGQLGQGSFVVTVLPKSIVLTSSSAGLASGRYYYDIQSTDSVSGATEVSSLKEFKLLASVTGSVSSGAVVPPINTTQQLIDNSIAAHNSSLSAHPSFSTGSGAQFDLLFTQSDLTSADLLPVQHTLPSSPSSVSVLDGAGNSTAVGWRKVTNTAFELDLADFVPLLGTWSLSATN